jgi:hypothetical protein
VAKTFCLSRQPVSRLIGELFPDRQHDVLPAGQQG